VRLAVGASALAFALMTGAGAAQASFSAHGSVEQVYVTQLAPGAQMSLLNQAGGTVATKQADAQGGLLFRNVSPGTGYRVRLAGGGAESGPLTVLSTRPAPPSTNVYNQTIPSKGYGYLTTRDGTKLAIDVHPPQDVTNALPGIDPPQVPAGPTPTLIEYSATAMQTRPVRRTGSRSSPTSWGSRSSTSTCGAPAARAARTTSSNHCRTSTGTT